MSNSMPVSTVSIDLLTASTDEWDAFMLWLETQPETVSRRAIDDAINRDLISIPVVDTISTNVE